MKKFTPYDKLSKKKQREINRQKRNTWNGLNPVTRKSKNEKAYNRKKVLKWSDDSFQDLFLLPIYATNETTLYLFIFFKIIE